MRFVSVDLYYIRIASTPNYNSSNYVKIAPFFLWDVNLHLEYLLGVFKVYKWLLFSSIFL